MKNRMTTVLFVLVLLVGLLGMTASAEADVLILQENTDSITITQDTYLNLNGFDVGSVTVSSGKLYVFDGQTDDFTVADGNYGKITSINGDFAAAEGYVMVNEDGYSFHKVDLSLTDMSLRAENVGLYCKSNFAGDEVVAEHVKTFGVALSIKGEPTVENLNEDCQYSTFSGSKFADGKATSTILKGIMKVGNANLMNRINADTPVYARAYIQMDDGSYTFGQCQSRSLKQQAQGVNGIWTLLSDEQKDSMRNLFAAFQSVMKNWDLTGISLGEYADIVDDANTWYEEFMKLPIVNSQMTLQERRQLALDAFRLQLSYTWTPNMDLTFVYDTGRVVEIKQGIAYSGMAYVTSTKATVDGVDYGSNGGGNVFKMLKYYDPATGVLDLKAMGDPQVIFNTIGSHCTWGMDWGWCRAFQSAGDLGVTGNYTPGAGITVPVGNYNTYEEEYLPRDENGEFLRDDVGNIVTTFFSNKTTSSSIIERNGQDIIAQAYAQLQIADCLVSSNVHHVMMCSGDSVLRYIDNDPDKGIDYVNSGVWVIDQNADYSITKAGLDASDEENDAWSKETLTQPNGKPIRTLGDFDPYQHYFDRQNSGDPTAPIVNFGTFMSYADLIKQGYIPITLKEIAEDTPVEDAIVWVGNPDYANRYTNGRKVTLSVLAESDRVRSNYVMSDFRVEVRDPEGNVIVSNTPHINTRVSEVCRTIRLSGFMDVETYAPYANQGNTIHIYTRLCTGQWIEAFNTTLIN